MSRFLHAKQTYSSGFSLLCSTPSSHSECTYLQKHKTHSTSENKNAMFRFNAQLITNELV